MALVAPPAFETAMIPYMLFLAGMVSGMADACNHGWSLGLQLRGVGRPYSSWGYKINEGCRGCVAEIVDVTCLIVRAVLTLKEWEEGKEPPPSVLSESFAHGRTPTK